MIVKKKEKDHRSLPKPAANWASVTKGGENASKMEIVIYREKE